MPMIINTAMITFRVIDMTKDNPIKKILNPLKTIIPNSTASIIMNTANNDADLPRSTDENSNGDMTMNRKTDTISNVIVENMMTSYIEIVTIWVRYRSSFTERDASCLYHHTGSQICALTSVLDLVDLMVSCNTDRH